MDINEYLFGIDDPELNQVKKELDDIQSSLLPFLPEGCRSSFSTYIH